MTRPSRGRFGQRAKSPVDIVEADEVGTVSSGQGRLNGATNERRHRDPSRLGRVLQTPVKIDRQPQGACHVQGRLRLTRWRQQRQQFSLLLRSSRHHAQVVDRLVDLLGTQIPRIATSEVSPVGSELRIAHRLLSHVWNSSRSASVISRAPTIWLSKPLTGRTVTTSGRPAFVRPRCSTLAHRASPASAPAASVVHKALAAPHAPGLLSAPAQQTRSATTRRAPDQCNTKRDTRPTDTAEPIMIWTNHDPL